MAGSVDGSVRAYDLRMGQLRTDFIGGKLSSSFSVVCFDTVVTTAPVTAVIPTQDGQSYLATTLDSHVRLMDAATGKLLNAYKGQKVESYRCRSCFGHNEASVICGDENGMIWAWDLLDVSGSFDMCFMYS